MKVVAFNSSPRGEHGNTAIMLRHLFAGMEQAGAETKVLNLVDYQIKPCLGCFNCWTKTPGKCVHQDDVEMLMEYYRAADLVIYATPLYVDNISGLMKNFMDRYIPNVLPFFVPDENGETRHPQRCPGKDRKIMVVSCCGFVELSQFQVLDLLFRRFARNGHSQLVGQIFRTTGELLQNRIPQIAPIIEDYFLQLKQAGREIVEQGGILPETQALLDKPLVPGEDYIRAVNQFWQGELEKLEPSSNPR